ncbi:MAG: aminopeptidase [Flavobacteriaceae bacterium]|nr:aminopeptidase [Flavobacteriaceae bacterium]
MHFFGYTQTNEIHIDAELFVDKHQIGIDQEIIYFNNSNIDLDTIYLHNWANAYKNRHTPLSKRLIENYDKSLYFAKIEKRGYSKILNMTSNGQPITFENLDYALDIVQIILPKTLKAQDSIKISTNILIKIPIDKFTKYGYNADNYNLRYWYLSPVVFDGKWHKYSNLDMDDLYMEPTNYSIDFKVPLGYTLHADLPGKATIHEEHVYYHFKGKNRVDIEINVQLINDFSIYNTDSLEIISNLKSKNLTENIKTDVLNRQIHFISDYLGNYPHDKLLINKTTYLKNPVYGFNQLPKVLSPFTDVFEWDIKMFKALTNRYIENTIIINKRKDMWLTDGIQTFLMMEYVKKYYSEVKAIGRISKIWGVRSYNLAKLDFNGKYPFVYQFSTRKNYDQSLTTRADSLSNFNRKIVNKYKAGLGFKYLDAYLNDSIVKFSLNEFYKSNYSRLTSSHDFNTILESNTKKNLNWFFEDYLQTNKKIDYTINKIEKKNDSVKVYIKNKSDFKTPITLYGINKKEIVFKKWIVNIDSAKTITVPIKGIDRLSLNYEYQYPEFNLRDNWKKLDKKILNRPLKFTFFKDIEDPYYNQIFYNAYFAYNFYDGLLLGPELYNQAAFKKKWLFNVTPTYGFKSKTLTGSFSLVYEYLPKSTPVYRYSAGFSGGQSHYDEGLTFKKFTPFFSIEFDRKTLRDVGGSSLFTRFVVVDKEIPIAAADHPETYQYNILNIRYTFFKPDIINDLRYFLDFQYAENFSKISLDFRYRKLTNKNRQFDFRLFAGTFLFNNTESDFFSFALDRPSDYLFDYGFLGRSEDTGFFSQQIIISEGGFKSIFENKYANQWLVSSNISIGIWRWVEAYTDAGFIKNNSQNPYFRYDTGIRLNFIHNFLEIYFPLQSSLGFEPSLSDYGSKIRFVLTVSPQKIYRFIKRGFY